MVSSLFGILAGQPAFFWLFTEFRENEDPGLEVAGQQSRQRLDCACLQHRFPFGATRQTSPYNSRCPEPKAPVKPDALHTLARATNRLASMFTRSHPVTPEFRDEPIILQGASDEPAGPC